MLPEKAICTCKRIAVKEGFPTDNVTDIIVLAIARLDYDIEKACKTKDSYKQLVNDIIRTTKELIENKMMSDKLYGWKEEYKEKLKL